MAGSATAALSVAIVGNPNTGKSTLFNALAGARARVGNYPGVTVERKVARLRTPQGRVELIDLPGTYSLAPRSLDEMVAVDVLLGRQAEVGQIDLTICVVDASNLERNLYLVTQLLELGCPLLVVFNMWDVVEARGIEIDVPELSRRLGVPIVCTSAARREGIAELVSQIHAVAAGPAPAIPHVFPEAFERAVDQLRQSVGDNASDRPVPEYLIKRLLLDVGGYVEKHLVERSQGITPQLVERVRAELAAAGCPVPIIEARARYAWIRKQLHDVVRHSTHAGHTTWSDRIDGLLTHRYLGLLLFIGVMFTVFQAIYRFGESLIDVVDAGKGLIADGVLSALAPGLFRSLLVDGAIEGVGSVLVFLPQIALLFLFIAVLEDCGYMARAAFLMDRWMGMLGLSGKSFVPLMSSFACAVPGIMATRVIENWRDRMVTILIAPLMSCAARLPVYLLLIETFIPPVTYWGRWITLRGLVLLMMYSLGALVSIPVAWLLRRFVFPGQRAPFVLELPSYKWPAPPVVFGRVWDRCVAFVARAGTLIFATSVVVWALGTFPSNRSELFRLQTEIEQLDAQPDSGQMGVEPLQVQVIDARLAELQLAINHEQAELVKGSFLGRLGRTIEPVVHPLGWDWRLGVGVLASFPAREVVIATLGTIYSLGGEVDQRDEGLRGALRAAQWPDGRAVYTVPVALSVMVFFALCAQCGATLMVIRRETNSWKWPLVTFGYMTAMAYLAALVTYQLGTWIGGG